MKKEATNHIDNELEAFMETQLEIIDDILSKKEVDLDKRSLLSADIFVKYCVRSVNGKSPDENYIIENWFKYVINPIDKWYKEKYGSLARGDKEKISKGLVLFCGVFFKLEIPLRILVPKGDLLDLIFPKEILTFEKEFDFIRGGPKFPEEDPRIVSLKHEIRSIVNLTRSICNNLISISFKDKACWDLSYGIQAGIEKAVMDVLSREKVRQLNSYWELHLAIEKSIKILICQAYESFEQTHDLIKLWSKLDVIHPGLILKKDLEKFPSTNQVIQYRYGKGSQRRNVDIYANYKKALILLETLTRNFERKVVFNNTIFTLGKLPWRNEEVAGS